MRSTNASRFSRVVGMDSSVNHAVIVGGPEVEDELFSIVLDDGKAIPLFDSVEEAETFLASTGTSARVGEGGRLQRPS